MEGQKKFYMNNRVGFLAKCFQPDDYPAIISDFLDYVADLEFDAAPDYQHLRNILNTVINTASKGSDGNLIFTPDKKTTNRGKKEEEEKGEEEISKGVDEMTVDESSNMGKFYPSSSFRNPDFDQDIQYSLTYGYLIQNRRRILLKYN